MTVTIFVTVTFLNIDKVTVTKSVTVTFVQSLLFNLAGIKLVNANGVESWSGKQ